MTVIGFCELYLRGIIGKKNEYHAICVKIMLIYACLMY